MNDARARRSAGAARIVLATLTLLATLICLVSLLVWETFRLGPLVLIPALERLAPPTATPMPTPRPLGEFTTYTSPTYGYSVERPDGWVTQVAGGSGQNVTFSNYDPGLMDVWPGPPLYQVEIDADENAASLTPLAFFKQQESDYPDLHFKIMSQSATTIAGRSAERIVFTAAAETYPDIQCLVAGHGVMFLITQTNAAHGQPSPVYTRALASFTING